MTVYEGKEMTEVRGDGVVSVCLTRQLALNQRHVAFSASRSARQFSKLNMYDDGNLKLRTQIITLASQKSWLLPVRACSHNAVKYIRSLTGHIPPS